MEFYFQRESGIYVLRAPDSLRSLAGEISSYLALDVGHIGYTYLFYNLTPCVLNEDSTVATGQLWEVFHPANFFDSLEPDRQPIPEAWDSIPGPLAWYIHVNWTLNHSKMPSTVFFCAEVERRQFDQGEVGVPDSVEVFALTRFEREPLV